jgi:hypothetical protein
MIITEESECSVHGNEVRVLDPAVGVAHAK